MTGEVTPPGAELPQHSTAKSPDPRPGDADSGAVSTISAPTDPDLGRIVAAWPALPDAIRAGIVAMVNAAVPAAKDG